MQSNTRKPSQALGAQRLSLDDDTIHVKRHYGKKTKKTRKTIYIDRKRKQRVNDIYLITISNRKKNKYLTKLDILEPFLELIRRSNCTVHHSSYELGSKYKQLHLHAIIVVKSSFRFKQLVNHKNGMYIDFKRILPKDLARTIQYVYKDNKKKDPIVEERIFVQNYYNNNYGFIDDENP